MIHDHRRMAENRSFWSRLISPFRRSTHQGRRHSVNNGHLRLQEQPFHVTKRFKSDVVYIPKCLGDVNTSSLLYGGSRPERFSYDCWLENHLNRFGDIGANANTYSCSPRFDMEDTFFMNSETDSDFVFRNHLSNDRETEDEIDSVDEHVGRDSNDAYQLAIPFTECDPFSFIRAARSNDSDHRDIILNGVTRDYDDDGDDATLRGSTESLESTVSEVLGMLDDALGSHSSEPMSPRTPNPPPYSAVDPTSTVTLSQYALSPEEPPPRYSELFGPGAS